MEKLTVARPYAQAIFDFALSESDLVGWSVFLERLAQVMQQSHVSVLLKNPLMTHERCVDLLQELLQLQETSKRACLAILVTAQRLTLIPEIVAQFAFLKTKREQKTIAIVESAWPLEPEEQEQIRALVQRKLSVEVSLDLRSAPELIGGFRVVVGHWVLDASVKGQVAQLATAIGMT